MGSERTVATIDQERLDALRSFCERRDWDLKSFSATQREPGNGVVIVVNGVTLRSISSDGLGVALARMETALAELTGAHTDAYILDPPPRFGRL